MGIEWYRDLSITLMGFISTLVFIFFGVIIFLIYRQARSAAASVKAASNTVNETVGMIRDEVVKPVFKVAAFVEGLREGIEKLVSMFQKREEQGGGKNVGQ